MDTKKKKSEILGDCWIMKNTHLHQYDSFMETRSDIGRLLQMQSLTLALIALKPIVV